jgi:transposase InsO family protein
MAYSINPNLPKARAIAMKLLIRDKLSVQTVANRCGVHRTTIWRWKQKWLEINKNVQFDNPNRPNRIYSFDNHLTRCSWRVPTLSSKPQTSPMAIPDNVVELVLTLRRMLKRCAEVIWYHLVHDNAVVISLSSVRRILKRHHEINVRRKRVRRDNPHRPLVTKPGELVQTDTIHYVDLLTKKRRYVYTVIDLYTRMAYAEVHSRILPGKAANAIANAQKLFGFSLAMVQADNGPEFGKYFEQQLKAKDIQVRHSRLGRPNDNAHIERFNRTIQEECLGRYLDSRQSDQQIQVKINKYLDFYNNKRVHLSLQYKTPSQMLQRS